MSRQGTTGDVSERKVKDRLEEAGLRAKKPVPDRGVDLVVTPPGQDEPFLNVQVKGRGVPQKNGRYRWFQVRTTQAQRERAISAGVPVEDTWEKKVNLCDYFILVAEKYDEFWVLPQERVIEIGRINRTVYGNRKDNRLGHQAELDLDIEHDGRPLTEVYGPYLDAFSLLKGDLRRGGAVSDLYLLAEQPTRLCGPFPLIVTVKRDKSERLTHGGRSEEPETG